MWGVGKNNLEDEINPRPDRFGSRCTCAYYTVGHKTSAESFTPVRERQFLIYCKNMGGTIQQIRQDLAALEQKVAGMRVELHSLDLEYLNLLTKSGQKQLILACYQVCTHKYPEAFVRLSFNQRQELQQEIRQIGQQFQPELFEIGKLLAPASTEVTSPNSPEIPEDSGVIPVITNPETLFQWQQQIEEKIHQTLDRISREVNQLLQQAKILSHQLPAKVLDMAMEAEKSGSVMTGPPNLLNLMVEAKSEASGEDNKVLHLTAIRLRLAEIEFVDTNLGSQRHQIRNLLAKLNTIRQQYQKKQKELAIAEAETAWRSSWFEE